MRTTQTTQLTVDAETGEIIDAKAVTWGILPPAEGLCQVCGVDHLPEEPHDAESMYYQTAFKGAQGRTPTWADALAHVAPKVRERWKMELEKIGRWSEPDAGLEPITHFGEPQPIKTEAPK